MYAGLHAAKAGVRASVAGHAGKYGESFFPLSVEGLENLARWLNLHQVVKVALLQGSLAWPWQAENARKRRISGQLNLQYWLEYEGTDAFAHVAGEAAWQPVLLALRDRFTLFLVRPDSTGGRYPVQVNRDASRTLATMLANGDFIAEYPKQALERLIEGLAECQAAAIEESLAFFTAESRGYWHNRARAKMARRLKHCALADADRRGLVHVIERRLLEGKFTEQFKDQLRLMLHLDIEASRKASGEARMSILPYVRKYGEWLAERIA